MTFWYGVTDTPLVDLRQWMTLVLGNDSHIHLYTWYHRTHTYTCIPGITELTHSCIPEITGLTHTCIPGITGLTHTCIPEITGLTHTCIPEITGDLTWV